MLGDSVPFEQKIDDRDEMCVAVAGLCHDLGHGPFSHLFDGPFLNTILPKDHGWSHEYMSTVLFNEILKDILAKDPDFAIKPNSREADFIQNLIEGKPKACPQEKPFLFDIVNNSRNSIDVDKFDYILRDCRCINLPSFSSFNPALLTDYVLPINGEICYP